MKELCLGFRLVAAVADERAVFGIPASCCCCKWSVLVLTLDVMQEMGLIKSSASARQN